jgi:hypothetical protein
MDVSFMLRIQFQKHYAMKTRSTLRYFLAFAGSSLLAMPMASAALLMIDFNHTTPSPTESGFIGQSASGIIHSTAAGNITVSFTGQQGTFDRGASGGVNNDLYRDFIFENTTGSNPDITITLTGPGIAATTNYILTFYAYDSGDASRRTSFQGISGTTGTTLGPVASQATGVPDTLSEYAVTGTFTSSDDGDGSGTLTFGVDGPNGTERTVVNGFQLAAIPEPGITLLGSLGMLMLFCRRRK